MNYSSCDQYVYKALFFLLSMGTSPDHQTIQKEVDHLLAMFARDLSRIPETSSSFPLALGGFRQEITSAECDNDFRARMFANAPWVEHDCIVAEKKTW